MAKLSKDRKEEVDFSSWYRRSTRYNKIGVGNKSLSDDAFLNLDAVAAIGSNKPVKKQAVLRAIETKDAQQLRVISDYFYNKSGIYERLVKYMAHFFRYDFFVTPVQYDKAVPDSKVVEGWYKACMYLENSKPKRHLGDIAVKVIKNGCFYGYRLSQSDREFLQELPIEYCRSRYEYNGKPAVEFNVKYFDDNFSDNEYRLRVVKMFPKEIQKAYVSYKRGTLPQDFNGDDRGWVLLDPTKTVKFNVDGSDIPMFINVIPHLLDLEKAQGIDLQKMLQQIMKIVIQRFPLDKNNDLVFDLNEMEAFHEMAVDMLGDAPGVDVLSTLADVSVADMSDKGNVSSVDQLEKVERTVYNEAGVSQAQFNTDGAVALERSIANDGGSLSGLVRQFEEYLEDMILPLNKQIKKKLVYRVNILPTTIYNYVDMASTYREQTMLGYSKLLTQVALGMPQTVVMSAAKFENDMLKLGDVFIPPQMSSTMSANGEKEAEDESDDKPDDESEDKSGGNSKPLAEKLDNGGRPSVDTADKSDTTIASEETRK